MTSMMITTAALSLLLTIVQATTYPVGVTNCNLSNWVQKSPSRAVTLNQGVTEVMLALGLEDKMVGTAFLDDEIWPEYETAYNKIPVLAAGYPDVDTLMNTNPDFLYASYSSAFQAKTTPTSRRIDYFKYLPEGCSLTTVSTRGNRTYCRAELKTKLNINTYLQTAFCELAEFRPANGTVEDLYGEIFDISLIFDALPSARKLIDSIEGHFASAAKLVKDHAALAAAQNRPESSLNVLWLDSWDEETPYVGACCGSVNTIISYSGAKNIFDDEGIAERRTWANVAWSDVIERDPNVIIIVDAAWDPAPSKIFNLCNTTKTRNLKAVQNRRFITVPFSATTLGVRIGVLSYNLAEAVVALANDEALSSLDFTEISIGGEGQTGAQAVGKSGAKVYTRLPVYKGKDSNGNEFEVDLESFCPGKSGISISDPADAQKSNQDDNKDDEFPVWVIALMIVLGVISLIALSFIFYIVHKEKEGNPVFSKIKQGEPKLESVAISPTKV